MNFAVSRLQLLSKSSVFFTSTLNKVVNLLHIFTRSAYIFWSNIPPFYEAYLRLCHYLVIIGINFGPSWIEQYFWGLILSHIACTQNQNNTPWYDLNQTFNIRFVEYLCQKSSTLVFYIFIHSFTNLEGEFHLSTLKQRKIQFPSQP